MVDGKRVACVVLNYNDAIETEKYARMVSEYDSYDVIIIVDNCSPDGSFEKLRKLKSDKIFIYQTDHNGGYGYGNNFGVKIAKNDFGCDIAFISNPDVSYTESSLIKLIHRLLMTDDCALIASTQWNGFLDQEIADSAWKLPTYYSYVLGSLNILRRFLPNQHYQKKSDYIKVDCVPGAFLGVKIDLFLECGGYDERIFLYCEESTLAFRLKKYGYNSYLATKEKYYHFVSTSIKKSIPSSVNRQRLILKSRMFYLDEYLGINHFQHSFAKICFSISLIEEKIKQVIRNNGR